MKQELGDDGKNGQCVEFSVRCNSIINVRATQSQVNFNLC